MWEWQPHQCPAESSYTMPKMNTSPIITLPPIVYVVCLILRDFIKYYSFACTLYSTLGWFLNVSPYHQPVSTLRTLTSPYLNHPVFRSLLPRSLANQSPLLAFLFLDVLTKLLNSVIGGQFVSYVSAIIVEIKR